VAQTLYIQSLTPLYSFLSVENGTISLFL